LPRQAEFCELGQRVASLSTPGASAADFVFAA
jgi:hypothetical protein